MSARRSMKMRIEGAGDVRVEFDVIEAARSTAGYDWSENHTLHDLLTGERLIGLETRLSDDEWHEIAGDIDARMTPEILQKLQS